MAFQQEARSLGWAQSQPSALVGRADPFPGCVRRHVAVAGSLCISRSPPACRASPALVHPRLALVLTALRCPSCEAAGPLLPTGPAGLLLSAVQGLPLWLLAACVQKASPRAHGAPHPHAAAQEPLRQWFIRIRTAGFLLDTPRPGGDSRPREADCPPPCAGLAPSTGTWGLRGPCSGWGERTAEEGGGSLGLPQVVSRVFL